MPIEVNMDVDSRLKSCIGKILAILSILFVLNIIRLNVSHKTMIPELHILPDGYVGKVYVLFNVRGYEKIKYEDEARIYNIPSSGILLTRSSKNTGFIDANLDVNFRFKSKDEFIKKLIVWDTLSFPDDTSDITVFEFGYGGKRDFKLNYPILTYTVDTFANTSKEDTYLLRETIIKSHYPDFKI